MNDIIVSRYITARDQWGYSVGVKPGRYPFVDEINDRTVIEVPDPFRGPDRVQQVGIQPEDLPYVRQEISS